MNSFQILNRNGSLVTIQTLTGEVWLTRRVKHKKDSRRRKLSRKTVRYIPLKRIPSKGDWLFTCSLKPLQFSHWEEKNLAHYSFDITNKTQEEIENFLFDDFITLEGSGHSKTSCGLHLISEKYAQWFLEHKVYDLYEVYQDLDKYEDAVKQLCAIYKIKFEGI